jgi:hypothetical protein
MYRYALTAGILAAVGCLSLHAQTINVKATIPFEFQIGSHVMPAGDYSIFHSAGVLRLRGENGAQKSAMVIVNAASAEPSGTPSRLVFNRYGDEYFLAKVWQNGYATGVAPPPAKRERELAARARQAGQTIALAAK